MRVAIIDLGTNTCRLFLADVAGGIVRQDARVTTVVRLGQGVDDTGRLHPDAVVRTRACLSDYEARVRAYRPERRLLIATSVLRDAADGRTFLAGVERDFALPWRVLAGEEEGALAFRGGTSWLARPTPSGPVREEGWRADGSPPPGPLLLVDIGGGSTEFAVGAAGQPPDSVQSLDVGVVRLTERFFHADPPTRDEVEALADHVAAAVEEAVPADLRDAVRAAVGVAGTYTTLVATKLGMTEYDASRVQGHVLSLGDIETAVSRFAAMTSAERGRLPGIQPGREDVILAGALIAREALRAFGLDAVIVSEADLLEGAALALVEGSLTPS
ncbi:MAG: Ppx/GppA family phosphatase [Actinobacteria bacterium]|nr:Ppx/GppA family phosphatase [Actinomycetota bacterium]